jgi:glutamine amidotransferase
MCRLLLIINTNYNKDIIIKFLKQSIIKKNTPNINSIKDSDYHKDGFGLAWKSNHNKKWIVYKKSVCYITDNNINTIINSIEKNILIGHIRSSCPNNKTVNYFNTHPFYYKNYIWCHNGCATNLNELFNEINNIIPYDLKKNIKGNTDSEYLFYYFIYLLNNNIGNELNKLTSSIIHFFKKISSFKSRISANLLFCSDNYVFVSRYINNNKISPSLYYDPNKNIISSEPLTEKYQIVPDKSAWIISIKNKKIISKFDLSKLIIKS